MKIIRHGSPDVLEKLSQKFECPECGEYCRAEVRYD